MIEGYTGDQRVLLEWAQAWRGKVSDDYVKKQVVSDPHCPPQLRVIGPPLETPMFGTTPLKFSPPTEVRGT